MSKLNPFQLFFLFFYIRQCLSGDPNVLKLNDINFERQITFNKNLLIMFFIPWSGMCQRMRPQFAQAATILKNNDVPVRLAKMDCSGKGRRTCLKKKIDPPFPVLHFYQNGHFVKVYTGSRDARSLIKFMRVQVDPDPVELKSVEQFKEFLNKQDDVVVVGFFEEETKLRRMFFRVANEMKEGIIFAYSSCEKLLMKQGVLNGIVMFRPTSLHNTYEEDRILFTGRTVIGEIKNFILRNFHGLVGYRTPLNLYDFTNPIIIVYYTIDYNNLQSKEITYWRTRLMKVAHKYKKDVKIAISAKDEFEEEIAEFNTDHVSTMNPFVLGYDLENQKYVMKENFTTAAFDEFCKNFVEKKLTPYFKSVPIPRENDGDVIVAVTRNFNQTVIKNGKDTLLDLYAPWSLKCQKFAPVLRDVALLLEEEDVAFVKMDITVNEVPPMFDRGVPNIYWLPKHRKKGVVLYQGGRTVEDVVRFVAKHATHELHVFDRKGNPKEDKDEL